MPTRAWNFRTTVPLGISVMVFLVAEDLVGAKQLLQQDHPCELVRKRLLAERNLQIGTVEHSVRDPERATDHKAQIAARGPALLQHFCPLLAGQFASRTVQRAAV